MGLEILVSIPGKHRQEFMQTFDIFSNKQESDQEFTGACIDRSIFECIDTPDRFLWLEEWIDFQSLDHYMKTDRFKALLGAVQVLGELVELRKFKVESLQNEAFL